MMRRHKETQGRKSKGERAVKLGIIGTGNMASAILKGYLATDIDAHNVYVVGHSEAKTSAFASENDITACSDIEELTQKCDALLIAVKPKDVRDVLAKVKSKLDGENASKLVISIAAGISTSQLTDMLTATQSADAPTAPTATQSTDVPATPQNTDAPTATQSADAPAAPQNTDAAAMPKSADKLKKDQKQNPKIIRVMPNTPAMVCAGMSALCRTKSVTDEEFEYVMDIFRSIGEAEEVPESLMDAVTGVSGSGPAFVYMFIEALADGAVFAGLPREKAQKFAAQTVLGSAMMVLKTNRHPGELKDAVCSPAGTTIEGVKTLENAGFRSAVMNAVIAAAEKSRNM